MQFEQRLRRGMLRWALRVFIGMRLLYPELLLLGMLALTMLTGCGSLQSAPETPRLNPPAECLKVCDVMPEGLDRAEWGLQMVQQYTDCAVSKNVCRKVLLQRLEK